MVFRWELVLQTYFFKEGTYIDLRVKRYYLFYTFYPCFPSLLEKLKEWEPILVHASPFSSKISL
jgi:hypothetical protein